MKQLDIKQLDKVFAPFLAKFKRYVGIIFFVLVSAAYGFLIFRVNLLLNAEPTQLQIEEKLSGVKRPKVDQATVDKIQLLQDQNVEVRALFEAARTNPFHED